MKNDGILHFASDWQPYVKAVRQEMNQHDQLVVKNTKDNPLLKMSRPSTRFERRGLRLDHQVSDLYCRVEK